MKSERAAGRLTAPPRSEVQEFHERALIGIGATLASIEDLAENYRYIRDEKIREAAEAGLSNVSIARATGLTRSRVGQIVSEAK